MGNIESTFEDVIRAGKRFGPNSIQSIDLSFRFASSHEMQGQKRALSKSRASSCSVTVVSVNDSEFEDIDQHQNLDDNMCWAVPGPVPTRESIESSVSSSSSFFDVPWLVVSAETF